MSPNQPLVDDHAAQATSALLWLMFHCAAGARDARLWRATEQHLHALAASPEADPLLRHTCEQLAAIWSGRQLLAGGTAPAAPACC